MRKQGIPAQNLLLILGLAAGLLIVLLVIMVAIPKPQPSLRRDAPQPVHERVVQALDRDDAQGLYRELSPALRDMFASEALLQGQQTKSAQQGQVVEVKTLVPTTVKSDPPWNGEWAESQVTIRRASGETHAYLVRFHKEADGWWLFGTLLLEP